MYSRIASAALTAALALLAAGCRNPVAAFHSSLPAYPSPPPVTGVTPSGTPAVTATGAAAGPSTAQPTQWVIPAASLRHLAGAGMSRGELRSLFDNTSSYIIENGGASYDTGGWVAHRVLKFNDETVMEQTLAAGLPAGIDTVLLDLEKWPLTPKLQQEYPGYFYERGAAIARQHRLTYLVTPGTDLAQVLAPRAPGPTYQRMLKQYVDGFAARGAAMIDIQAQSLESNPGAYLDYIRQAAAQARANQPGIRVFADLSGSPGGSAPSPADFAACIRSARPYVSGYLLWVPPANAGTVASVLKSLG
jgi:hypothetical protein